MNDGFDKGPAISDFIILLVLDFWMIATVEISRIQETISEDNMSIDNSFKNTAASKLQNAIEKI